MSEELPEVKTQGPYQEGQKLNETWDNLTLSQVEPMNIVWHEQQNKIDHLEAELKAQKEMWETLKNYIKSKHVWDCSSDGDKHIDVWDLEEKITELEALKGEAVK